VPGSVATVKTYDHVEQWSADLGAAASAAPGVLLKLQKQLVFLTLGAAVEIGGRVRRLRGVVLLTPVDEGRARASRAVFPGSLVGLGLWQTVWITSSLPYIEVLEYGGYPDPPLRGSWNPRLRRYEVKSAGGFSRQAPRGMVRITYAAVLSALGGG